MLKMDIWYVNIGSSNDREFSSCAVKTVSAFFSFFVCFVITATKNKLVLRF